MKHYVKTECRGGCGKIKMEPIPLWGCSRCGRIGTLVELETAQPTADDGTDNARTSEVGSGLAELAEYLDARIEQARREAEIARGTAVKTGWLDEVAALVKWREIVASKINLSPLPTSETERSGVVAGETATLSIGLVELRRVAADMIREERLVLRAIKADPDTDIVAAGCEAIVAALLELVGRVETEAAIRPMLSTEFSDAKRSEQ